ncbi:MAG: O-antigen ligase family protein [Bacteroidia bacterium]
MIPESAHRKIYVTGLILLSLGILFSGPVASMSTMLIGVNWISEKRYRERLRSFLSNKTALLLSSVFLLHLIGLAWTSDFQYALNDIKTKIPLIVLPFFISTTSPLSKKEFHLLMAFFTAGTVFYTLISMSVLAGWLPIEVNDIRDISPFISHIRLSLMICLSIFALVFFLKEYTSVILRMIFSISIIWLIIFMGILESLTGLSILIIVTILIGAVYFSRHRPRIAILFGLFVLTIFVLSSLQVYSVAKGFLNVKPVQVSLLPKKTVQGNPLYNDTLFPIVENGTYVMLQICWEELSAGWEKKSKIPFDTPDSEGNRASITLIRYMASKGMLRKDAESFATLSPADIHAIENGVTNYKYQSLSSLNSRIYESIWEIDVYRKGSNPSGHSMTMRFEFWKTGWHIFRNNWVTGVGTGDVKQAFMKQYRADRSQLTERWQLRGHNQYLAIAVAFGLPGLLLFLLSLIYPLRTNRRFLNYWYVVFWLIICISMLTEDTLETQAGVNFYAFFNSIFIFAQPRVSLPPAQD